MITPSDAEKLAIKKIQEYISACGCLTTDDVGNALMKMLSVTGQAMLAAEGQKIAVARILDTAEHINKPKFLKSYRMEWLA